MSHVTLLERMQKINFKDFVYLTIEYALEEIRRLLTEAVKSNILMFVMNIKENCFQGLNPTHIHEIKSNFPNRVLIDLAGSKQYICLGDISVSKKDADEILGKLETKTKEVVFEPSNDDRIKRWQKEADKIWSDDVALQKQRGRGKRMLELSTRVLNHLIEHAPEYVRNKRKKGEFIAASTIQTYIKMPRKPIV